jgi:hypothetical protein
MLKVNLLPPYIHMRKKLRMAIVFVVILLIAEVGGLIYAETGPAAEFARLEQDLATKQAQLAAVQKIKGDTDKVVAEEGSFKPKWEFLVETPKYNRKLPELYDRTQRYIYRDVMLLDIAAQQNSMQFSAYVSDPVDVSRLMLGLTRSPDFNGLPQVTGVPGFGQQEKQRREQEGGSVPESSIIGSEGSRPTALGGGGQGAPGPGMGPGMMGGGSPSMMAGPGMSGGMGGPGMMSGPPGGMAGGYPGGGGGMMGGMGGGMMGGMGGMGGGMGGGSGSIDKLNIQTATQKPRGFTVQVKAELKNTITRPSYMSSDTQAGKGGGGGGGMGGMMGMMGGMGGGMAGGYPGGGGGMMGGMSGPPMGMKK